MTAALLILSACGGGDTSSDTSTSSPPATTTTTEDTTTTTEDTTTTASTSTTIESTTTTASDGLPGEPFDLFMDAGDELGVMGVAFDDVLNVRAKPGTDQPVLETLAPTDEGVVATGEERLLPNSIWYEVDANGTIGWVSSSFVGFVGGVDDSTSQYLAEFPWPEAETMNELGQIVADNVASEDPPSRIVRSVAASVGDLGEVTYDVIGIGDDATAGWRLHIFGTPTESGEGFSLKSIERTTFCSRGLSGELCT